MNLLQTHQKLAKAKLAIGRLSQSRILEDGATTEEIEAESRYADAMYGALAVAYLHAINGLQPLYGKMTAAELEAFIMNRFRSAEYIDDAIYSAVSTNGRAAYNVGGQIALDTLGLDGSFDLTDEQILELLEVHFERLLIDGEYSLLVTTAAEVARQAEMQANSGALWDAALGAVTVWYIGRATIRAINIAETEGVRMSRLGLVDAFASNGIATVIFRTQGDEAVCPVCRSLNGKRYEVESIEEIDEGERIPLHSTCRCYYDPDKSGWIAPAAIWTGYALG